METKTVTRAVLVYQAGIANVFAVECFNMADYGREARRLYQGDFRTAEAIARGMVLMGCAVGSAHCNQAGDIIHAKWSDELQDAPFCESMRPVWHKVNWLGPGKGWEIDV